MGDSKDSISSTFGDNDQGEKFNANIWHNRISKGLQKEKKWRERGKNVLEIYADEERAETSSRSGLGSENRFNILYANTETLMPALFSAVPKPNVTNRYQTQDPIAKSAGEVIERVLSYSIDTTDFKKTMQACVKHYLLPGRGVVRERLIPEFEKKKVQIEVETENGIEIVEETEEVLKKQTVRSELVQWDSFIVEPAKTWEDVTWIAFIHMLTKKEFERDFPDAPPITVSKSRDEDDEEYGVDAKYKVYEVWDKNEKKVYYLGDSDKPLRIMDDPLELEDFWPIPDPLYSIKRNETLVPIPEYTMYQYQHHELNQICHRIPDLIKSCKFNGIYDSEVTGIEGFLKSRDSQLSPVPSNLMRNGGIKSIIDFLDVSPIVQVISQLYVEREQIKSIIHEITGISDIIRGDTNAAETARAQSIKEKYAGLRLRTRRDDVNDFIVKLLRIKAEIICRFFTTEQMQKISGIEITPEIEELIRSDVLFSYKIDIETDSTILADMDDEAQKRASIIESITQFMVTITPLVQQGIVPLETAKAMLMYALQSTKITRELQDSLELIGSPETNQNMPMPINGMGGGGMAPQGGMPQDLGAEIDFQEPLSA